MPPLEECLAQAGLPVQPSHVRLSRSHSNSTPSTPEMRVHRQLSLRYHTAVISAHIMHIQAHVWVKLHNKLLLFRVICIGYPALTRPFKGIEVAPEVQGGD